MPRNKFVPLSDDIPKPAPVLAPVQVAPAVDEDVCHLEKYTHKVRTYINMRLSGVHANLPVCRCNHTHVKEDIPCLYAGLENHDRDACVYNHDFFGPCRQTPLCRHDGKDYHDPTTCKFRHTRDTKQKVVAQIAAPPQVVSTPPPPPPEFSAWVPLPTRPAATTAPAPVAALGITPPPTTAPARSWGDEVEEEEDLDAEIARLEAEVARQRAQKLAKIAALKAKLGAQ